MKCHIATWFYSSPPGESVYYPGVGSNSSEWSFQKYYWYCILTFFDRLHWLYSVLPAQVAPSFLLFLNEEPPYDAFSSQIDLRHFLKARGVNVVLFNPSLAVVDKSETFATQFYIYDVLKAGLGIIGEQEPLMLFDSDVLPLRTLALELVADIHGLGASFYPCFWSPEYVNNGVSCSDFHETVLKVSALPLIRSPLPGYSERVLDPHYFLGGEFLGFSRPCLQSFLQAVEQLSALVSNDSSLAVKTEEHLNTLAQKVLGMKFVDASSLVKRVWTDSTKFCNVSESDLSLPFLHLPAEKQQGFYRYYHERILPAFSEVGREQPLAALGSEDLAAMFNIC